MIYNLFQIYSQPHRKYHGLNHINYMLNKWIELINISNDKEVRSINSTSLHNEAFLYAIWYHDYYVSSDNLNFNDETPEYESSQLARGEWLLKYPEYAEHEITYALKIAIRETDKHGEVEYTNNIRSMFARVLCDLDILSLSEDYEHYHSNSIKIIEEYKNICKDDDNYLWHKRSEWIQSFLDKPKLFHLDIHKDNEVKARHNLKQELEWIKKEYK